MTKTTHIFGLQMLNEILFPIFLFAVVFCFECCLLYNPQRSGKLSSLSLNENTKSHLRLDESSEPKLEPQQDRESKPIHLVSSKPLETLRVEDIDSLKLEQARKLAKEWGIKLSVKGKKKRLDWLKRELRVHLQKFRNSSVQEKGLSSHNKAS
jgi:hypothetical protein